MEINAYTAELISEIELRIGSECYNPKSYDGYRAIEGLDYRYPVTISKKDANEEIQNYKVRGRILDDWDYRHYGFEPSDLRRSKYVFGTNHLYICRGIQNAMSFLEERYNLNFEELENNYKKGCSNE